MVVRVVIPSGEEPALVELPFRQLVGTIDWDDASSDTYRGATNTQAHTFTSAGSFDIEITGTAERYGNGCGGVLAGREYITAVLSWGDLGTDSGFVSLSGALFENVNLTSVPATLPIAVTDLQCTFRGATSFNGDISTWDTSHVTDMSRMFLRATSFDRDLGSWNITSLTAAEQMFTQGALSLGNYGALLRGWAAQAVLAGVWLHVPQLYDSASAGARATLVAAGWTINDLGPVVVPTYTG